MDTKIYFQPGDIVTLNKDIPNKPIMYVVKKKTMLMKSSEAPKEEYLLGIICRWFTTAGEILEETFNTKDLEFV